ncbi:hypothetical protein K5I29_09075 [Flavobacterium agricola]|uniref:Lipoprotein n=1 Tax=Flavobacterium agricola TaxID=2870839 RepID=A0ABY6M0N6_9FLAO|nr:hypothetical protein [Flavobacterium agricola]UYW00681.1 hypothetical protein K5I29_09075 [Flavobacterium agricola]
MKKAFWAGTFLLVAMSACKKETKPAITTDKNQFESEFYGGCMQAIQNSGGDLYNEDLAANYCSCVIRTVLPALTDEEKAQISSPNNLEVQTKVNALVQPCLDDYLTALESLE